MTREEARIEAEALDLILGHLSTPEDTRRAAHFGPYVVVYKTPPNIPWEITIPDAETLFHLDMRWDRVK